MKVAPNKGSIKIMLKINGCHGYLMTSSQNAKNGKNSAKTYITLKSCLSLTKRHFLVLF